MGPVPTEPGSETAGGTAGFLIVLSFSSRAVFAH